MARKAWKKTEATVFFSHDLNKENIDLSCKQQFVIERKEGNIGEQNTNPAFITSCGRNLFVNEERLPKGKLRILLHLDTIEIKSMKKKFIFTDWRNGVELDDYSYDIQSNYFFERLISKPAMQGTVALAHEVRSFGKFAVKSIKLFRDGKSADGAASCRDTTNAQNEIDIMLQLNHPNVLGLVKTVWNHRFAHLFTEYMDVGDLFNYVIDSPLSRLIEPEAKFVMFQVCQGLNYLHDLKIGHGDLKLENIFVKNRFGNLVFKIGDFGLSVLDENVTKNNGTFLYRAPEIFQEGNPIISVRKSDMWSLGIIIYACLSGHSPFDCNKHPLAIKR